MFGRDLSIWFDEAKRDGNPFLTEWFALAAISDRAFTNPETTFRLLKEGKHEMAARYTLVAKYSWAIPCDAALNEIAKHAPLIEIGAGTGYWAWQLRKKGVDIVAFDKHPAPNEANNWHKTASAWTKVERGDSSVIAAHAGRTLFLCWPPYDEEMAFKCLEAYTGDTLIFVGEGDGGCTADLKFWEVIAESWVEETQIDIPQFEAIHDYLTVFKRMTPEDQANAEAAANAE